ncbi:hypothetical protein D3C81_286060 [compost metagenome]|uniref:hypothetical protein n=1 Tax=Pseudomonas sp. 5 TaxID=1619949 RepID=UPI0005EBB49F|nr:hypothetical protein [Pseudomonas sp. 5]KJK07349.1 hypothetical protein UB47_11835 [Pseudomonas sp. 5]
MSIPFVRLQSRIHRAWIVACALAHGEHVSLASDRKPAGQRTAPCNAVAALLAAQEHEEAKNLAWVMRRQSQRAKNYAPGSVNSATPVVNPDTAKAQPSSAAMTAKR